jgi:dGTPase
MRAAAGYSDSDKDFPKKFDKKTVLGEIRMKIDYSAILKTERLRKSSVKNRTLLTESESDRGRVLFSPAFRRLQQKAQVFSMEPNAAVRSRLTHSLEVSHIGRYIADQISLRLAATKTATELERSVLVNFVETACLMHDIGNPPFGHFGEAAIQKWFDEKGPRKVINACKPEGNAEIGTADPRLNATLADFREFDGNPQGLRVVTKLQWNTDPYGLNLTVTTLASYLKYVRMAGEPKAKEPKKFTKKAGYFSTEADLVRLVWDSFDIQKQRFPLAYIMEAADDIAYCISDLEDSIEKDLLRQKEALQEIKEAWLEGFEPKTDADRSILNALSYAAAGQCDKEEYTFTNFRTALNRTIVEYVAERYIEHHQEVFDGSLATLLPPDSGPGSILETLKSYCKQNVYCHESVQRTELAGYTAIYGLLEHFGILLDCSTERFTAALDYSKNKDASGRQIILEKKFLTLFPEKYRKVYEHEVAKLLNTDAPDFAFKEWNARAHLIVDFVAGMTDDFAMNTYRNLSGMRL